MNKIIAWIMLATFATLAIIVPSHGSQESEEDFVLVAKSRAVYHKVNVPQELSYNQLKQLKSGTLEFGSLQLANPDHIVSNMMPSNARIISNSLFKGYKAKLVNAVTQEDEHLSTFHAIYEVEGWKNFIFTIVGVETDLQEAAEVRDLDHEAKEPDPVNTLTLGYNSPMASHIRMDPEILEALNQLRFIESFELMDLTPEMTDPDATRKMILHGAKYAVSTVLAPVVKKYVPGAQYIYALLPLVKTAGFPTITHLVANMVENRGRVKAPLFEKNTDPHIHQFDHAISRGLGCVASFVPGGSFVRSVLTKAVQSCGYPTITHCVLRHRDMTAEEIKLTRSGIQLAEDAVALGVETVVPCGVILITISQNAAKFLFGKPSMTAATLHKLSKKKE